MSEKVPEGWSIKSIGSIFERISNGTTANQIDREDGVAVTRIETISDGVINFSKVGRINDLDADERYLMKRGDILFSNINSVKHIGKVAFYNGEKRLFHGMNLLLFRADEETAHNKFLFNLMRSDEFISEISKRVKPAINQASISGSDLKEIKFLSPPLPEQKKIASILTSVDEVIETTQKQIDKLQDLKKATMNELLTKGIGHTEFKDSELGRIPKSWDVRSLSEVSELSRGKFSHRPRNDPAFYDGDFPFLQTGDIPTDNLDIAYSSQSLNNKGLQVSRLFPKGTLVITIAATVGEVAFLTFDSCFPDSLVGITTNESVVRQYFLLFCLRFRKQVLIQEAPESAQKNLNLDILNPFQVAVPPLDEQRVIESTLLSIQKHIEKKKAKLSQTQSLKKSLMQDLLTGKVRVQVN